MTAVPPPKWGLHVIPVDGEEWTMESLTFDARAEADEYAEFWNIAYRPEDGHGEFRVVPLPTPPSTSAGGRAWPN